MGETEAKGSSRASARSWWIGLGLAVAAVLAQGNGLHGPFVLDDTTNFVENPSAWRPWPLSAALNPAPGGGINLATRPVLNLSYCVDHAIWGFKPSGYRATNVLLHIAATLALFGLVRRTAEKMGRGDSLGWGAAAALLWTVHPLLTTAVKYLSQRGELLVGLFLFVMLYALNRAAEQRASGPGGTARAAGWLAASVFACLLGMGSKENMAAAPFLALAYDRIFLSPSWKEVVRRRWGYYLALALTWIWPVWRIAHYSPHMPEGGFPLFVYWRYLLTQAWGLVRMVRLAAWPSPLIFDYGVGLFDRIVYVWPHVVLCIGLLAVTGWALWRHPRLGFLGLFFLGVLAPSSSLMPITGQPVAEHRMYAPLAALLAARVNLKPRALRAALLGAWVVSLGIASRERNKVYASEPVLWGDTVQKRPRNLRAHAEYGRSLCEAGQFENGLAHLELIKQDPFAKAGDLANLGLALAHFKRFDEAMACYRNAIRLSPESAVSYGNMGRTLVDMARTDEAVAAFEKALELRPDYAEAHYNLANLLFKDGRPRDALAHYQKAAEYRPGVALNWFNLGVTWAALGNFGEAERCVNRAWALDPMLPGAWPTLQRIRAELQRGAGPAGGP
ncbi:MAG TPA: tetratricopeptide repeat protein [Kiritimatiellia bacterium]|nr:tetratricopeptide repeat protein [Kiritimatiellia bacterium]HRZ11666.1 tetratricopeptide repeat protein [Kiritimatiellia bacterium]HSA16783.1 tetratricopeptide repeat protein [Kiritimatiellia bacterium]